MGAPSSQSTPEALEGMKLIHSVSDALLAWTAVPPSIIQSAGSPDAQTRRQRLLVRSARKFCDDFGAAVVLLRMGFVGPSHAILRMCRENVAPMLFLALTDQSEAERFIRFVTKQKPAETRLRLHRRAKKMLDELGETLPAPARARLSAAILGDEQCQTDEAAASQDGKAPADYTFNRLVARVAQAFERHHGIDARNFLTMVVDYHIESEVTHSGFEAIEAYHVEPADWEADVARLADILTLLMDLRTMTVFTTNALLDAFGMSGRIPKPEAVKTLAELAAETGQYLQRLSPSLNRRSV